MQISEWFLSQVFTTRALLALGGEHFNSFSSPLKCFCLVRLFFLDTCINLATQKEKINTLESENNFDLPYLIELGAIKFPTDLRAFVYI